MLKLGVLKKDTHRAVTEGKATVNAKDTGCISDINSVRYPSKFTTIKRSKCCPDILYTSGAHIPLPGHGNVIVTEMIAGRSPVWHRKCVS